MSVSGLWGWGFSDEADDEEVDGRNRSRTPAYDVGEMASGASDGKVYDCEAKPAPPSVLMSVLSRSWVSQRRQPGKGGGDERVDAPSVP